MSRLAVVSPLLCAVAWVASASDLPASGGELPERALPGFQVETRNVGEAARVVADSGHGWRLERYFGQPHNLVEVEDVYGQLVRVVRNVDGRPIGVLLARRYAIEYFYSRPGGQWQRRVLYEPRGGKVIAEVINSGDEGWVYDAESLAPVPTPEIDLVHTVEFQDRPYAFLPTTRKAPVIRSLDISDPTSGAIVDRIDYTGDHIVVHLGSDVEGRPKTFAFPRHTRKATHPVVVRVGEPAFSRFEAVWSLAGRERSAAVSVPNLKGVLPSSVEERLREAFPEALEKVREVATCRTLFEEFAASGNQKLSTTLYAQPNEGSSNELCIKGALAYTHVGSSITRLCPGFGGLSGDQAVIVLIHEALHYAGMREAPSYRGAMTSKAINELVFEHCGF